MRACSSKQVSAAVIAGVGKSTQKKKRKHTHKHTYSSRRTDSSTLFGFSSLSASLSRPFPYSNGFFFVCISILAYLFSSLFRVRRRPLSLSHKPWGFVCDCERVCKCAVPPSPSPTFLPVWPLQRLIVGFHLFRPSFLRAAIRQVQLFVFAFLFPLLCPPPYFLFLCCFSVVLCSRSLSSSVKVVVYSHPTSASGGPFLESLELVCASLRDTARYSRWPLVRRKRRRPGTAAPRCRPTRETKSLRQCPLYT